MNQTNIQVIILIVEFKIKLIYSMANGHFRNPYNYLYNVLVFKMWIVTKQLKEKERDLLTNELSCAALQQFCQLYTPKFAYEPRTVQIFHCVNSSVTLIAPQFQMFDVLNVTSFCASKWVLMFARPITTVFKYQEPAIMFC